MRTIQMTLDDNLVKAVDRVTKELHTNRSAFTRKALQEALVRYRQEQLEGKHRLGYAQNPVATDEFSVWSRGGYHRTHHNYRSRYTLRSVSWND